MFIVENNAHAKYTPPREPTSLDGLADCAGAHAIPGVIVDGQDAIAVEAAVLEAIARARAGDGPSLFEIKT